MAADVESSDIRYVIEPCDCRTTFAAVEKDVTSAIAIMNTKKPANEPKTMVADDPEDRKGRLKDIGGSQADHWNNILVNQAAQALWMKNSSPEERDKQLSATVAALIGIGPKDELEGMMAAQPCCCAPRATLIDPQ